MRCNDFFVIVFLGTNGCGKTILANKLANSLKIPYVNIDQIGKQHFSRINDYNEKMALSAKLADRKSNEMLAKQQSFIIELALSNPKDLEFLRKVKVSGAKLVTIFVLTRDIEINISRVAKRVTEGGHYVPEYKIRERYPKCFADMALAIETSNLCFVYDNSCIYKIIAVKREPQKFEVICNVDDIREDNWLNIKIIKPLKVNNQIFFSSTVEVSNDNNLFNKLFTLLSYHIKDLKNQMHLKATIYSEYEV